MIEEWFRENGKQLAETIGFILLSFISFRTLQFAVRWYLFGKCTFRTFNYFKFVQKRRKRSRHVPDSQSLQVVPPNKKWRISNEVVSLIHSVVSGIWALYACLMYPKLVSEMNTYEHETPLCLIYLSFGYLLHDFVDLCINERSYRILELLFHHVVVLSAFMTTLVTSLFLGVVIFGLLMELNSIFLHSRSLMNLYGQPKNSTAFKFIALLNILTFALFRMAVSIYLIVWQLTNALSMTWYLILITFVIIFSLFTTNSVLLYRVLAADGIIGKKRTHHKSTSLAHSNSTTRPVNTDNERTDDGDESSDFDDCDGTDVEATGNITQVNSNANCIINHGNNADVLTTSVPIEIHPVTTEQVEIRSNGNHVDVIVNFSNEMDGDEEKDKHSPVR